MKKTRRELHSTNVRANYKKVLRKINGAWVAVLLAGIVGGAIAPVAAVSAESTDVIENIMNQETASDFVGKAELLKNEALRAEIKKAVEAEAVEEKTVEMVREEIARQEAAQLKAYVVQAGDTLTLLAEATGLTVEHLANANGLQADSELITGDILTAVLKDEVAVATPATEKAETADNETPVPEAPEEPAEEDQQESETPAGTEEPAEEDQQESETPAGREEPAEEDQQESETPAGTEEPETPEADFDFDTGFDTKEEAIKQAEALVKNSKIYKGFIVTQGADNKYYIQLTVDPVETKGEVNALAKAKEAAIEEMKALGAGDIFIKQIEKAGTVEGVEQYLKDYKASRDESAVVDNGMPDSEEKTPAEEQPEDTNEEAETPADKEGPNSNQDEDERASSNEPQ